MHRFGIMFSVLAVALAGLGALGAVPRAVAQEATPAAMAAEEYVANAADFVEAANWEEMQEVTVELDEFSFTPSELTFEAGVPYELKLRNVGQEKHYFTAHEFYRAIATRKAESVQSEVKVPYFTALEVYPGQEIELYFVPVLPGTFELFCEIEGHADAGMRGTITVTGEIPTAPAPVLAAVAEGDWVQDGTERVASADWEAMETVSIELGEYFFEPDVITLQVDQPYKLELKNGGQLKHEFTASSFYRSVAFRKAQDAAGEYKAPHLSEIEVFAGQQTDLYLIPAEVGEYELVCEIEGHKEAGMVGTIVVVSGN
jgi:uncharacterized cupredoxin-like copper-binding protein